jgi:hypothetical protein
MVFVCVSVLDEWMKEWMNKGDSLIRKHQNKKWKEGTQKGGPMSKKQCHLLVLF